MRYAILPLLLVLIGCRQEAGNNNAVTRIELAPDKSEGSTAVHTGATANSACVRVEFEGAALTHCVADPARHRITTALSAKGGAPFRSFSALRESIRADNVAFAVNAGMFDQDGRPIGYYVEQSDRLKPLNLADGSGNFHLKPNGVFFGSGGKWQVMDSETFAEKVGNRPEFGTQSGPMLVIAGKIHPKIAENGPSRTVRNGVGVDDEGNAHFVLSEGAVSFGLFARYFRDRLKTPNALYLDGSISGLWDPASGRSDASVPLGPLIVVTNRNKTQP